MNKDVIGSRQRRKEARPAECVAAALDVFVERGYAAARLEEIAQRAGISKGTLYLYFENKEALFKAVITETLLPLIALGEQMLVENAADPQTLLREMVLKWWSLQTGSKVGEIARLVFADGAKFPEIAAYYQENVVEAGRSLLGRVLQMGVEQGVFRPIDPILFCHFVFAPLLLHCMWRPLSICCGHSDIDPEKLVHAHLDLLLSGLLVRPVSENCR